MAPTPNFKTSRQEVKAFSENTAHGLGPRGTEPAVVTTVLPLLAAFCLNRPDFPHSFGWMFACHLQNMIKIPATSNPLVVFGIFGECWATVKGDGFVAGPATGSRCSVLVKAEAGLHERNSLDL